MKKTFKVKECNKNMLQTIIKQMVIVDKYINLRICETFTDSSSYLPAKDVVKYMKVDNEKLFTNQYDLDKPIRMSFILGSKLLILLSQFENEETIDIDVVYDSETEEDEYYALKVIITGDSLSITEVCADKRFDSMCILPINDKIMQNLLDDSDCNLCFLISKDDIRTIKSLGNIDRENRRFEYVVKDNVLSVRERSDAEDNESEIYSKVIESVEHDDVEWLCNKNVFGVINNITDYNICICVGEINKVLYTHKEDGVCLNIISSI